MSNSAAAKRRPVLAPGTADSSEGLAPLRVPVKTGRFCVVGDLQPTSALEVWRESNHAERRVIIRAIAGEGPDFLALLGDLVFCGSSGAAWADFDLLCAPLRSEKMLTLSVLGNHEYWINRRVALANFFQRFPHSKGRRWYSASYGPLGLVFLDSNYHWLSGSQWTEQLAWYRDTLQEFEAAGATRGILIFLHHPPFTNSRVTSDTLHVQRDLMPPFQESAKALAMISGHVHSYERFERQGKVFLVTGGGGGPRAALAQGVRRRHSDDVFEGPPLRSFHFLNLALAEAGLDVEVQGLEKGGEEFAPMDRFLLAWPDGLREDS